jgi:hypothetical protein
MLNHPTLDRLNELGLFGMAKAFSELMTSGDAATLSIADGLALLLDRESSYRNDAGTRAKVVAGFALGACLLEKIARAPSGRGPAGRQVAIRQTEAPGCCRGCRLPHPSQP